MNRDAPSTSSHRASWDEQPLEWPRTAGHGDRLLAALELRQKRLRRRRSIGFAGGLVALALAGVLWRSGPAPVGEGARQEPRGRIVVVTPLTQTLPDGSIVELKPGAEIAVDFSADNRRRVSLRRGEAHFQVAKNPERPFVVEARGVEFRAVGTAFSVGLRAGDVEMLVTEGRVAVRQASADSPAPLPTAVLENSEVSATVVAAGQRVVVAGPFGTGVDHPAVVAASEREIAEMLAWRVSRVEFNESPLAAVVASLNRHGGRRVRLVDSELAQLAVSGVLRANNIEPLLQMLESNYHVRVTRPAEGDIELRAGR